VLIRNYTYLNAGEVQQLTGISPKRLEYHRKSNNIQADKLGRQYLYRIDQLNKLFATQLRGQQVPQITIAKELVS
jgi:hypothetical protein